MSPRHAHRCLAKAPVPINDGWVDPLEQTTDSGHSECRGRRAAVRFTRPGDHGQMRSFLVAFIGFTLLSCTAAQAAVAVTVDKNTQTLTVAVDGVPRYQWPVSTGVPSYETPDGTFRAFRMDAVHVSKQYDDAPMPDSIFFTKTGIAIHG